MAKSDYELNHGFERGDKILYGTGFSHQYVKYLGYSNLDDACFIAEDDDGYVSDDYLWEEIDEEEE